MNDSASPEPEGLSAAFSAATAIRELGGGDFTTHLHPDWVVGGKPHGGYLLALLARAGCSGTDLPPVAISANYLRVAQIGPVLLRTETLKEGRTITTRRVVLEQSGRTCVDATVTLGELPEEEPAWTDIPDMPADPPETALDAATAPKSAFAGLSRGCDLRLDPVGAGFLRGESAPPRLRLWVRPRHEVPDLFFALCAGDMTIPVTYNLGHVGWSPTVQLTALLRHRPASGWLRLAVESRAVHGGWFDEDVLVVDSAGRVVCQARQLAIAA
ncbi:thioesterase family protein [Salinifilum aidingensis]